MDIIDYLFQEPTRRDHIDTIIVLFGKQVYTELAYGTIKQIDDIIYLNIQ